MADQLSLELHQPGDHVCLSRRTKFFCRTTPHNQPLSGDGEPLTIKTTDVLRVTDMRDSKYQSGIDYQLKFTDVHGTEHTIWSNERAVQPAVA